ncbi:ubiquitin carboxyl-terminal hydrolase 48-like [Labrus bergylta]|uniref:ubiquitin carboxyl-terminal hydrolase 48-like n=1 Tax=Labrus bergylta TaxID=56723 RepID=UPI00331437C6
MGLDDGIFYHKHTEHFDEKPFACENCGAKFGANSSLKSHMRLHTGEKPFNCKHCDMAFSVAAALAYHTKKKHSEDLSEPHDCQKCCLSFSSLDEHRQHIQDFHPKEYHKCPTCSKVFTSAALLEKHKSTHTGSKPFSCDICNKSYQNTFVGLTNLGATCYVNTFLQVWFHNLELRRSLYQCHNSRAQEHNSESDYEPQSISDHLHYLFALLQNSNRKYINPSGLVKALGLDTGQQQDAQEFSKLFMSLLEDTLSKQKSPSLQIVIQQQFCGQFSYVTFCNQCGRSSALRSRFYELELNIQGHKNLNECVTEFLKVTFIPRIIKNVKNGQTAE